MKKSRFTEEQIAYVLKHAEPGMAIEEIWFLSLADARRKISAWRTFYNEDRPHAALAWKTPAEFNRECGGQANSQVPKEAGISTD